MEGSSLVSKARTAFHSAAAKAEKVFTDIKKSDFTTDRDFDNQSLDTGKPESAKGDGKLKNFHEGKNTKRRPAPIKTKQDWQERLKNIGIGKRGVEDINKTDNSTMSFAIFDENLYLANLRDDSQLRGAENCSTGEDSSASNKYIIPPSAVIKQLAITIEAGKNVKSMKDLMESSRGSSPLSERASLSFSAMKSLVLREKDEKFTSEFITDDKASSLINSLLDAEGHPPGREPGSGLETLTSMSSLPKDIHGVPPECFVVKLSEAVGNLKTLKKMALFWHRVVAELRKLWCEEQYIPGIPPDEIPDLNSCLLYQQLQVINCCVSRKRRHFMAAESLDSVLTQANLSVEESDFPESTVPHSPILYARTSSGELILRLGADKKSDNLTMLETGEPVYTPIMQEGPLLTEDLIKETEEFVLRTGSVGAGCSQLLSDMQAFKAANPGCILEDFVRWHSPPDWMETETSNDVKETFDGNDSMSGRGQLSSRMQKEGNLWRELWETAKPVPAVKQAPLYDEDLAVEGILNTLEDIPPSELFEQLFISLLGSGFVIAESILATNSSSSKLFFECKDYVVTTCQGNIWVEKVADICQVYETVEMMLSSPDYVLNTIRKHPEEAIASGEQKGRFKRLSLIFGGKNKQSGKTSEKDLKNSEENPTRQSFSSLFSKKPPKPGAASPADKSVGSVESDWQVV